MSEKTFERIVDRARSETGDDGCDVVDHLAIYENEIEWKRARLAPILRRLTHVRRS